MVRSGQAGSVAEFGYSNPDRPHLGIEVLDFADLQGRVDGKTLAMVHRTDFHQLFLVTAGAGQAMVDFVDRPCERGTLLHVGPGQVLRLPRSTGGLEALVVLFTATFPPRLTQTRFLLSPFAPVLWTIPPEEWDGLTRATRDLKIEYRRSLGEPDTVTADLVRQLLGALLLRIARLPVPGDTAGSNDETFQRFQQELEKSFAVSRNAADYATHVGYSLRSLNRVCEAATGRSAKALIDARVALEAKRLLVHTDLPAAAIGHRLGFTEPTNFGKFFTRETGMTPGAFRDRDQVNW